MTNRLTRRTTLAVGTAALAGCTTVLEEDKPDESAIEEDELLEIAAGDRPTELEAFPVEIADSFVEEGTARIQSLLEAIPEDLEEIPNEAVGELIETEAERAQDSLAAVEDAEGIDQLSPIRNGRSEAAKAAAAYAVASDDASLLEERTDESTLEDRLEDGRAFEHAGEEFERALVVYEAVEDRLRDAEQARAAVDSVSTVAAEVEAESERAGHIETGLALVAAAQHLVDQHTESSEESQSFEEAFRETTENILEATDEQVAALPFEAGSTRVVDELFNQSTEGAPRSTIGGRLVSSVYGTPTDIREDLEAGYPARALMAALELLTDLEAIELAVDAVDDGAYDRPADADAVKSQREAAVSAIEATISAEPAESSALTDELLREAVRELEQGDDSAADELARPETKARGMVANYAIAETRAQAVPEALERFDTERSE